MEGLELGEEAVGLAVGAAGAAVLGALVVLVHVLELLLALLGAPLVAQPCKLPAKKMRPSTDALLALSRVHVSTSMSHEEVMTWVVCAEAYLSSKRVVKACHHSSSFSEKDWTDAEGIGIWKRIGGRQTCKATTVEASAISHQPSAVLGINQHRERCGDDVKLMASCPRNQQT